MVKICDFGWAALAKDTNRTTFCGTADYLAPEIAKHEDYSKEVDVWAVGVLLYEMLTGKAPFSGSDMKVTISNIARFRLNPNDKFDQLPMEVKDLIG